MKNHFVNLLIVVKKVNVVKNIKKREITAKNVQKYNYQNSLELIAFLYFFNI